MWCDVVWCGVMYVLCLLYASNVLYVCMYVLYVPFVPYVVCTACMCVLYVCTVCTVLYTYTNNYIRVPTRMFWSYSCIMWHPTKTVEKHWKLEGSHIYFSISDLYIKRRLNLSVFPQQVQILSEWIYYTVDSTHPLTNLSYVFFMFIHLYPTVELWSRIETMKCEGCWGAKYFGSQWDTVKSDFCKVRLQIVSKFLLAKGNAVKVQRPMCFAHRAQGLSMSGSTKSQDTWSVVIETHGEALHVGALQEAWNLDLGKIGALPVRWATKAQNTFEMTRQRQGLIHLGDFGDSMEETVWPPKIGIN